jgi:AcrR family transcriptional regulator
MRMSRTPDEARRAELLDAVVDYVCKHGVARLSLRPLAQAVDSSPRVLLYYFNSKEDLVTEVLEQAGARQRRLFSRLRMQHLGSVQACREIWSIMSAPGSEPIFRLLFEVYGLALQDRKRYARFLKRVVEPWLEYIATPLVQSGWRIADARAYATIVVAGFRGFLLDLCATRDRERIDRAVELWFETLSYAVASKDVAS